MTFNEFENHLFHLHIKHYNEEKQLEQQHWREYNILADRLRENTKLILGSSIVTPKLEQEYAVQKNILWVKQQHESSYLIKQQEKENHMIFKVD